ncbi:unnamed protein product [Nesidiocoris tenuis]|uniref:Uncharacterized protein n=2 Tax=Nesidiocoris tenuis TaxID=355587 RepID=A0A6H5HEM5_9HEMI|nr:unnamed protein product [Nesidiocoris tenuis]
MDISAGCPLTICPAEAPVGLAGHLSCGWRTSGRNGSTLSAIRVWTIEHNSAGISINTLFAELRSIMLTNLLLKMVSCQGYGEHEMGHHHEEHHEEHHEDYHEPHYKFEYEVKDSHTGDYKKHKESRKGDDVDGYYSLVEPDGTLREVHYTSAKHAGFNAVVTKNGKPIEEPHHEEKHEYHEEKHEHHEAKPFYEHAHVTEEHKHHGHVYHHQQEIEHQHHHEEPEHHHKEPEHHHYEIDEHHHEGTRHQPIVHHQYYEPRYHHREHMSASSPKKVYQNAEPSHQQKPPRPRHAYSVFESPKERRRALLLWGKA